MKELIFEGVERQFNDLTEEIQKEEKIKVLSKSDSAKIRRVAAELSTDSKFLNKMLRDEIQGENNAGVIDDIFYNEAFQMEQETANVLAESEDWEDRQAAAELSTDSKFLNKMLRDEMEGENNGSVKEAIFCNEAFQIEQETANVFAKSKEWWNRRRAAELSTDSKFLNKMLRDEEQGSKFPEVENPILSNEAFKWEEETLKVCSKSEDERIRRRVVREKEVPYSILEEMYWTETCQDILDGIEYKLLKEHCETSIQVNSFQKIKILKVLKKLRHSKKQQPLTKYLKQILEIIG